MSLTCSSSVKRALLIVPLPVFLLLLYGLPLAGVIGWSVTLPVPGLDQYRQVVSDASIREVMVRTLRLCMTTTVVAVAIAYLLSYCWVFASRPWQRVVEIAVFVPMWISVLVRAFGWLIALGSDGVVNGLLMHLGLISEPLQMTRNEFGVVIGMVHLMVPFAVFPLASSMRQVDRRTLLAARGMGANGLRTFWAVLVPQTLPGILGAFLIVFVFCLGFFITPAILGGGQTTMIAEYVYLQMFQTNNWGLGAALSVSLLAFIGVLAALMMRATRSNRLVN
ncbi:ABC transporter permease [Paraburkholderia pallida]|uniref:ABC transporter permease n=1 Tax=Paraburkholderia pallida TaxID=2547399 RepID=A0A4P7CVT0_9BURK|nr:ABC transporter permease [Paraburkholderia pallida]QBQ98846.1 ABC transporter permease [Paraburkholderia pallida]